MKIIRKNSFSFTHNVINALGFDTSIHELNARAFAQLSTKGRGLIRIIPTEMSLLDVYQDIPKISAFYLISFRSNKNSNEFLAEKKNKVTQN